LVNLLEVKISQERPLPGFFRLSVEKHRKPLTAVLWTSIRGLIECVSPQPRFTPLKDLSRQSNMNAGASHPSEGNQYSRRT
jgi:hypothetical protein